MAKHGLYLVKRPIELVSYGIGRAIIHPLVKHYIDFDIQGKEKIPKNESAVFVINHTMCLDGILTGVALPKTHYWVQLEDPKGKGVLSNRLLGLVGWAFGYVRVSLTDPKISLDAKKRSLDYLTLWNDNISVFPEGPTIRRENGDVRLYKTAAELAVENGIPLIAVSTDIDVTPEIKDYLWEYKKKRKDELGNVTERGTIQTMRDIVKETGEKIKYRVVIRDPLRVTKVEDNRYCLAFGKPIDPSEVRYEEAKSLGELERRLTQDAMSWCHQQQKRD